MKIALVGATGNVAGRALEKLAAAGAQVVVLVRHPEKLPEPIRSKAQVEQGTLEDGSFVARATRATPAADALLWLTPPTFVAKDLRAYTLGLAQNAAQAIRENKIARVVFVSSHGADRSGFGNVSLAGEVEKVLEAAAPNTVSLRAAGFMENLFASVEALKNGQLFGVLLPDKKYPLVATRDIGDVAARWLLDPNWSGHQVRGVHGPEDLTAQEQVDIMSRVLGKPIRYQQIPPEALRDTFLKRGASPSVADGYFDMFKSFAQKDYQPTETRTAETTTPTTFETFVREVLAPRLR
jgi:uncharacterized protein YbjT (DUF2867 family)